VISSFADSSQMPRIKISLLTYESADSHLNALAGESTSPRHRRAVEEHMSFHYLATVQLESGSNLVIAAAISAVVLPRSFCSSMPSWLMMNVITPELPYSAG
jgi:hypothetical protein